MIICMDCGIEVPNKTKKTKRCFHCKKAEHIEVCKRFRLRNPDYRSRNVEKFRLSDKTCNQNLKKEVFLHYCSEIKCSKCGFNDIRALQLDHINGGGALQPQKNRIYRWLKQNNYPTGYQVLCANCNWIKRHENHEWGIR